MSVLFRWLLISALFMAPIAIAQHQLDHLQDTQTIEHCDLCAHSQSIDPDTELNSQLNSDPLCYLQHSVFSTITNHKFNLSSSFLSRAPPR